MVITMDMNKIFFPKKEQCKPEWRVIDAQGQILGRVATQVAVALRGKDKAIYTRHTDTGDYVVVINAEKIVLTGGKEEKKEYKRHSGWIGGLKTTLAKDMKPTKRLEQAVKGMMPKTKLGRQMFKKLRVYEGSEHPHQAQCK
jgi:large subunit ribosomal protein L13